MIPEELSEFEQGRRKAHIDLMLESLRHIGYEFSESKFAALVDERERALNVLRSIYDKWPVNLDLADAIGLVFEKFGEQLETDIGEEIAEARSDEY